MKVRNFSSVAERRKALEKTLGVHLMHSGKFSLDEKVASSRHCENMIGVVQIPLGIAGPLKIRNSKFLPGRQAGETRNYYIPLATTEGALVASVNRGCKAISASGGATVDSYRVGATRGPVFKVNNLAENDKLNTFFEEHFAQLKQVAEKTSHHLTLKRFVSRGVGKYRYVRFVFDTQDAMGMNMVTIATDVMVRFIEEKTGARCLSLAGNWDVDKKPAWLNVIEGRGIKAWAEVTIPVKVLQDTLKVTAQKIYDVWLAKCLLGSALAGSMGFNAQYANVVAAIFAATGQDLAHISEGSIGVTTAEVSGKDLYVSVYLPDLMVGTVGGGTGLATQKEALSILGIAGGDDGENASRLAEIIGGAALAGEISLLASLAQGSLARAHERLGRGGK